MTTPTFTSTVAPAIASLLGHFSNVADQNQTLDLGVYLGAPIVSVADNFLAIGEPLGEGQIVQGYTSDFQGFYQSATLRRTEDYTINCWLRTWAGDVDQVARFNDAMTVISSVMTELAGEIHPFGDLAQSGEWELINFDNVIAAPIDGRGFGVIFEFGVHVKNVILTATQGA